MMKEILLARHPETEANVSGRWVGRGDTPFTPLGLAQARSIADEIVAFGADSVWSSPLERALVPAKDAAERLGIPLRVDERLAEMHFGLAEGLTLDEATEQGIPFDFKASEHPVAEGGESRREVMERTSAVLEAILQDSTRPAILTHGGIFRSALVHLLDLPLDAIWAFHIRNAQIAIVSVGEDWGRLEEFKQV